MAIKKLSGNGLTWINIDQVNPEALTFLQKEYKFHHLDIEDVRGESQTPKIDAYPEYLFLIVQFPHWNAGKQAIETHELNIFLGDEYLITIQHTRSKEMKNFFYRCMRNKRINKEWMNYGSGFLLYKLLDSLFKNTQPILNNIGKQLFELENLVFDGEQDSQVVKSLAVHRRNILAIRRIIDPQRYLMANLANARTSFLNEETSLYFDDVNDYLSKMWAIMDTYKDTVQGLHVTVESLITQKTNKVVGTLTAISVGLLPFTVLSGIYGMNIVGLPYAKEPLGVWSMFMGLAFIIIAALMYMKHRKWL